MCNQKLNSWACVAYVVIFESKLCLEIIGESIVISEEEINSNTYSLLCASTVLSVLYILIHLARTTLYQVDLLLLPPLYRCGHWGTESVSNSWMWQSWDLRSGSLARNRSRFISSLSCPYTAWGVDQPRIIKTPQNLHLYLLSLFFFALFQHLILVS